MYVYTGTRFISLCIAIIYCISLHDLVFTSTYLERFAAVDTELTKQWSEIQTRHKIAIGEENPAEEVAKTYFTKQIIPQIFVKCSDGYFSVFQETQSYYVPPKIEKWYHVATRSGYNKTYSTYKIEGFTDIGYDTEILEQSEKALVVKLRFKVKVPGKKHWYQIAQFHVHMDYSFTVSKVEPITGAESFPVFGNGYYPKGYSCEYLQSHIGSSIQQ